MHVRRQGWLGHFAKLEAGENASRFEDTVCFRKYSWDIGAIPDPKRNGVYVVSVIGKLFTTQILSIPYMERDLGG